MNPRSARLSRVGRGVVITALLAGSPARGAEIPWAIPDAPFRAAVKAKSAPSVPEAGYAIEFPELGQAMPNLADVVLLDGKGQNLAIAKIWRGEGQSGLLLARALPAGQEAFVYFGGKRPRRHTPWAPKTSLLLETRRLPSGTKLDDWPDLERGWKAATEIDGAGFVESIAHGENPFGESANFLSRYTGWLETDGKELTLYTLSSDASFVRVNDRLAFGWPGEHPARANANSVPRKEVSTSPGATRIDYYHAKLGGGRPAMVLGWIKDGRPETIPASAWLHPGATEVVRVEHAQGWPVPQAEISFRSYIGWNGLWLYETRGAVQPEPSSDWNVQWEWSDGAVHEGPKCERVLVGVKPLRVQIRIARGKAETRGAHRVAFSAIPRRASTQDPAELERYLELLSREDPARLSAETLTAGFQFLGEFGQDQIIGKWATAWLAKNPNLDDPLWIGGQLARLRSLAQVNPKQALADLRKLDSAARRKFSKELGLCELELLVFHLKDPNAGALANRIAFENANTDAGRLAKVRLGDLHR
nr:hypothetical protein [Verrucomicrobiota bacterium]